MKATIVIDITLPVAPSVAGVLPLREDCMGKESPLDRVTFTKAQIALLEKHFGTWSQVGKTVTPDTNLPLINREAGKQDVLDFIRERVI